MRLSTPLIPLLIVKTLVPTLAFQINDPIGASSQLGLLQPLTSLQSPASPGALAPLWSSLADDANISDLRSYGEGRKKEWKEKSLTYYSKVSREERRKRIGQISGYDSADYRRNFQDQAKKHFFALKKIKDGKFEHAEHIYRRIINEIIKDEGDCDHAALAVTTLLLALHLQRTGDNKKTRSAFTHFYRVVNQKDDGECTCCAKVLQAFALFEMKQGNAIKSLHLVELAIEFDPSLAPVLRWKQFQDVQSRLESRKGRPPIAMR